MIGVIMIASSARQLGAVPPTTPRSMETHATQGTDMTASNNPVFFFFSLSLFARPLPPRSPIHSPSGTFVVVHFCCYRGTGLGVPAAFALIVWEAAKPERQEACVPPKARLTLTKSLPTIR